MTTPAIEGRFFRILSSLLQVPLEQLGHDTSRKSCQAWDSLKHMHLVLALEEEFGIEFDDAEIADLNSAAALLDAVSRKVSA
ncbi:MAG TPA: acyl carrier protein [Candidatus Accumulibacter phosphatis]|nr:MAG: Acyl carrier protein [Candidatus Accumulibacter sp. SK-11]HAY27295.1 acyl carrier protein [Accumulibacter sp.]HRL76438.1 acyl carrier protein [Candidatus Accumulibacter phosphatis]HCN67471.1 acyl carrier protein [Accumulibacter sp.]HCV13928.1 acyl carrier protein [Accumulibacter sp.]